VTPALTVTASTFTGNTASASGLPPTGGRGGGVFNNGGTATLVSDHINNNTAVQGGGVANLAGSPLTLVGDDITGNTGGDVVTV
jgi:hypothetical protein